MERYVFVDRDGYQTQPGYIVFTTPAVKAAALAICQRYNWFLVLA